MDTTFTQNTVLHQMLQAVVDGAATQALSGHCTHDQLQRLTGRVELARSLVAELRLGEPLVVRVAAELMAYTLHVPDDEGLYRDRRGT